MPELTPTTIKATRQRLGLTQSQFADRIGCSALAVSFWERGTRTPTGLYARAVRELIADADAVPIDMASAPKAITAAPRSGQD
jgi:DNA-binding transcriptional regulator YiaG